MKQPRFWSLTTTFFVFVSGALNFLAQIFFDLFEPFPYIRIGLVVVGLIGVAVTAMIDGYQAQRAMRKEADKEVQIWKDKYHHALRNSTLNILKTLLHIIRHHIALPGSQARACIFVVRRRGYSEILSFLECSGDYTPGETELEFVQRQGVGGSVWHLGRARYVDLHQLSQQQLEETFHLTQEQVGVTSDTNSIAAVPIWVDEVVIGVLSLDSPLSLNESRLDDKDVLNGLNEMSKLVGKILVQGEWVRSSNLERSIQVEV